MSALVFTKLVNQRGLLTKTYALDAEGRLQKTTAAKLYEGHAERIECADIAEFMAMRATLQPHEALLYGVAERPRVQITTQGNLSTKRATHIARDAEHLHYAKAPGVLMLDHDPEHCAREFDQTTLRAALLDAVPGLEFAPMAWAVSASSFIVNAETGEELQGLRGQRLYIPIADATDIPRVGRIIYERLWAAGCGTFVVSRAGALLDRNIVDASAWQAERIDFAAGAACTPPVAQWAPLWRVWPAAIEGGIDPWDSSLLSDLTAAERERADANRAAARAAKKDEATAAREAYITERGEALSAQHGIDKQAGIALAREAVENALLFAEFVLHPEDGEPVTVGAVLDDPARWHGKRFADPLEPTYRNDRRIAWCNLRSGGRPYLYSHAHGVGRRYELLRQPAKLTVAPGDTPRLADECLRIAIERGDLFDFGTHDLARVVEGGRVYICSKGWLLDYLGRHIRFERFDSRARAMRPTDAPLLVASAIFELTGSRRLPKLQAVVTAPTMRADGTVLDVPGFDTETGLLYVSDEAAPPRVPVQPSRSDVLQALGDAMAPIAGFPFVDAQARGVALAAMLTACVRRSLPAAPGFAFDAPTPGTGKSLLASTVSALAGHSGASHKPPATDEELGKVLFAELRSGAAVVFLDNWSRPLQGEALDQFMTAETYKGRVLGESNVQEIPNRAMLLATGNNLVIAGDTCRRILVCRLDAGVENPNRRAFDFDPVQFVRDSRPRVVAAALTLMRGFVASRAPRKGAPLGSFEAWDALVRQTVCWLADLQSEFALSDPNATTAGSEDGDDSKTLLTEMLTAWRGAFGDEARTTAEALAFVDEEFETVGDDGQAAARKALKAATTRIGRATALGRWLRDHRDRVCSGLRFERAGIDRNGVALWRISAASVAAAA